MSLGAISRIGLYRSNRLQHVRSSAEGFAVSAPSLAEADVGTCRATALQPTGLLPLHGATGGEGASGALHEGARSALHELGRLQLALLKGTGAARADLESLAAAAERLEHCGGAEGSVGRSISLRIRIELARSNLTEPAA